ncbi:MAG: hypothetical protein KF845_07430 [Cyclobacteriaceae bacterium]|nr:hypothetical protein [Cyclobacteriaceae bacterium]
MKSFILPAVFLFIINNCFSQNQFSIKVYQNTDFFQTEYYSAGNVFTKTSNVNFSRISIAVSLKKKISHEVEFMIPEKSKSASSIKFPYSYTFSQRAELNESVSAYALRYEVSSEIKSSSNRFNFYLGLGLNPYFIEVESTPNVPTVFYSKTSLYGFSLNTIPRITLNVSERISLDLNIPFKVYDYQFERRRIENPHIPPGQRVMKKSYNQFFENVYTIRLGLAFKI